MTARLLPYKHVPPGFEIVIDSADEQTGKIWNLWWNVKLTEDPGRWDSEIESINQIQSGLGEPSTDQRLIRAQIAEFCRLHLLFPRSIDILCREIGENRFSEPVKIGCEGRGLLDSLGYHEQGILDKQLEKILMGYAESLEKWLRRGQAETTTDSKVFGFLGRPTDGKLACAEKLLHTVGSKKPSVFSLRKLAGNVCAEKRDDSRIATHVHLEGRPFHCFKCPEANASSPKCQCCYCMLLDAILLSVGTLHEKRSMQEEFGRFVEENILIHSIIINSWLKGTPSKCRSPLRNPLYISEDSASRIAENIHCSLGEKNEAKKWLTACLLKTLKDNQRWHKRTELIDNYPEATSWFKQTS